MKTSLQRQREYESMAKEEDKNRERMRNEFIRHLSKETFRTIQKKLDPSLNTESLVPKNNLVTVEYEKWPQIKISIYDMDKSEPNRYREDNGVRVMTNKDLHGIHEVWGRVETVKNTGIRRGYSEVFTAAPLNEKSPKLWPKSAIIGKSFRVTIKNPVFNLSEINEMFEDFIEPDEYKPA